MDLLIKYKYTILGLLAGATGGFLYYYFIGCNTGSCPITSKPLNSTLYGAMMGGLFFSTFEKKTTEKNKLSDNEQQKNHH